MVKGRKWCQFLNWNDDALPYTQNALFKVVVTIPRNGTDGLRAARLAYYFARICNHLLLAGA